MNPRKRRPVGDILVVDDMPANLEILTTMLKECGHRVRPLLDGRQALEAARLQTPDLILLDINMPGMDGYQVCATLKSDPKLAPVPVIFISANNEVFDKVTAFNLGGVDYITKPFQFEEVEARVESHLEIRRLQVQVETMNRSLQEQVRAQVKEISESQIATIVALAKISEYRDEDTGNHILRVQRYCKALAQRLSKDGTFGDQVDDAFVETIFHASALHDIGKVGIPDSILLKPGKHTPEEWEIMKTHAAIGARTLDTVLKTYPNSAFLKMGREIAQSHHERWDGSGYPEKLIGEAIPLSARILVIADQYDALRNKRPYKPAFDAAKTYSILVEGDGRSDPKHLDPRVLETFKAMSGEFEAIFDELKD